MDNNRLALPSLALLFAVVFLAACGTSALPGADGPPVVFVSTPEVDVLGIYMLGEYKDLNNPARHSTRFPSNTPELIFAITLPYPQDEIALVVSNEAGPCELEDTIWLTDTDPGSDAITYTWLVSLTGGDFPDGDYQTAAYLDGELIALLNWSIGE